MNGPTLGPGSEEIITHFLAEKLKKAGARGFVLGASGGIDSSVVLMLAARAVGRQNLLAIMMPEKDSPRADLDDAKALCEAEGVPYEIIDITRMVAAFSDALGGKVRKEAMANIKARCRMTVLYHYAGRDRKLVLGTSNKSELLIGYFTKYGDGGADLEPIGDLYKSEVRQLAASLGVPRRIVEKAPSAGLWRGQTDEDDIGMTYDRLDAILRGIELGQDEKTIAGSSGATISEVKRVSTMVRLSSHKRKLPPVVKMGLRTPGLDWREGDEDVR